MAMAYVLTMRGVPQIYYGTEILMENTGDESHGVIRSDFPGGWAGDTRNAFTGDGLTGQQREAQEFLRRLLSWRRDKAVIHSGDLTHFVPEDGTYVYFRHDTEDSVMVVLNKNPGTATLVLERFAERLRGYREGVDVVTGEIVKLEERLDVPARSVMLLDLR
jgi:glycosidase